MRTSNSAIQTFKSCRRLYELKYLYGLEPVGTVDALKRGSQYHELVEGILNGNSDLSACDNPKVRAMAMAFEKYIFPHIKAHAVEEWFSYNTKSGHQIIGRIDGVTDANEVIEHKTTAGYVDGSYFADLEFNEQILTYMLACHSDSIWYTVCSTPTIRQRKNETEDEFYQRCVEWFDTDTESKITCVKLFRDKETLSRFAEEQDAIVTEMEQCKLFYRNPNNCTKWGRMCEYAPVCMNYNPNEEYVQFKRRDDYYEKVGKAQVREAGGEQTDAVTSTDEANH